MRIAAFSDIHGNAVALRAVLSDVISRGGVDAYWALGDLIALGPSPVEVLETLAALPGLRCVRGNTDRYVFTGQDRPFPSIPQAQADSRLLASLVECANSFAWTQGVVTAGGWLDWLDDLPLEFQDQLPDGTQVLAVHASPGRDDGRGLHVGLNDDDLETLVEDCPAQLIVSGHTHMLMDRLVGDKRLVNLGSLSNPHPSDLRASYAILEFTERGCTVAHHRVDYDRESVIAEMRRLRHPAARYVIHHLSGGRADC